MALTGRFKTKEHFARVVFVQSKGHNALFLYDLFESPDLRSRIPHCCMKKYHNPWPAEPGLLNCFPYPIVD